MKKMILFILAGFVLLAGVSAVTLNTARDNAQAYHLEQMRTLLPGSENFTQETNTGDDPIIQTVHKAENGYVIETVTSGYADDVRMCIGVSNAGKVTGLMIEEAHETFGLGSKALNDHVFLAQFLNKTGPFAIGASGDGESVDGITGATVTSKAVARSVTAAVAYVTGADATSAATSWGG